MNQIFEIIIFDGKYYIEKNGVISIYSILFFLNFLKKNPALLWIKKKLIQIYFFREMFI